MPEELKWWEVWGTYCSALVAATDAGRAMALIYEEEPSEKWRSVEEAVDPTPPAPPTVEGVYHLYTV